jgi:hypothetical protein
VGSTSSTSAMPTLLRMAAGGRCVETRDPAAACAHPFGEGALRVEFELQFAGEMSMNSLHRRH